MNTTDKTVHLKLGTWDEVKALAFPIRLAVFVEEQGVPFELEQDEFDAQALHAVMIDSNGQAVATGRLVLVDQTIAKIGRLAVLKGLRGKGYGKCVLTALIEQAKALNVQTVKLHAQRDAEPFYRAFGFEAQGAPFIEAGIEHVLMVRDLILPAR